MKSMRAILAAAVIVAIAFGAAWLVAPWFVTSQIKDDTTFVVAQGATLTAIADDLEEAGLIGSADSFLLRAKLFGGGDHIQAGEFRLPANATSAEILDVLKSNDVIRRFVTVPEGMPSIMVHERLMAEPLLTGQVAVPEEGSILPDTYAFERGQARGKIVARMQAAMDETLARLWSNRSRATIVKTPEQAVILASIVEKETGTPEERRMIAGVLSNRLRIGMMLGADATSIYPITKGRPLGRMIRRSELRDPNPYNTRAIAGLPVGPITNPGREAIAAVLDPAPTDALYYVADGSGGHVFARTLGEHNENVRKWREFRQREGI